MGHHLCQNCVKAEICKYKYSRRWRHLCQNYGAPFVSKLLKIRVFIYTAREIYVSTARYIYIYIYINTARYYVSTTKKYISTAGDIQRYISNNWLFSFTVDAISFNWPVMQQIQ